MGWFNHQPVTVSNSKHPGPHISLVWKHSFLLEPVGYWMSSLPSANPNYNHERSRRFLLHPLKSNDMIIFHDPFIIQNDPYLKSYDILWFLVFLNNSYQHILAILHRFWFSHVSPFLRLAYLIFTSGSTGKPKAIFQGVFFVLKKQGPQGSEFPHSGFCGIPRKRHVFRMEWIHGMLKKIPWTRN